MFDMLILYNRNVIKLQKISFSITKRYDYVKEFEKWSQYYEIDSVKWTGYFKSKYPKWYRDMLQI